MGVISSLSTAIETLKRNPVLFVAGLVVALMNGAIGGGQLLATGFERIAWSFGTFAVQLASLVFVAGAYGMTVEALDGTARLGTLISAGKENFGDALAATILLMVAMFVASFVAMIVGIVGLAAVLVIGSDFSRELVAAGFVGVYLLTLFPLFFLQFYLPAVVASNCSPADSLKQSYRLVRQNLLATLGFDAVLVAVIAVGSLPAIWLYSQQLSLMTMGTATSTPYSFVSLSPGTVGVYVVATAALGAVTGTFFYAYQVAFYDECIDDMGADDMDADDVTPVGT